MKNNFKAKRRKLIAAKHLTSVLVASTILTAGLTTTSHAVSDRKTLKTAIDFNNDKMQQLAYEKEKIEKKIKIEKQEIAKLKKEIFDNLKILKQSSSKDLNEKIKEFENNLKKPSDFQKVLNDNSEILNLLKARTDKLDERNRHLIELIKILEEIIGFEGATLAQNPLHSYYYNDLNNNLEPFITDILRNFENIPNTPDTEEIKKQIIEYLIIMVKCSVNAMTTIDIIFSKYQKYLQNFNNNIYSSFLISDPNNNNNCQLKNKDDFKKDMIKYINQKIQEAQLQQNQIMELQTLLQNFEDITKLLQEKATHLQNLEKLKKELKKNQQELDEMIDQKDMLSFLYSDQKSSDQENVSLKGGNQQNGSNNNDDDSKVAQNQKEKDLDNNKKEIDNKKYNTVPCKANGKGGGDKGSSKPKTGVSSENWSFLAASFLSVAAIGLFLSKFFFKKRKLDEISN
ncbi:MAG: LPXTG cell wall anchor domain-containing protein [Oscillospiraceae bacterium]|jgi:LPXTG-motif cell wall-anchored protein|nr:LPXTG cell wall anchor domain-containing protein [Oscillospiraceae bacterium]